MAQVLDELRAALGEAGGTLQRSRKAAAKSVSGDSFDVSSLGEVFAAQDESLDRVRKAMTSALSRLHEALDARQRKLFAELLASGALRGFGGAVWPRPESPEGPESPESKGESGER